VTSREEEREEEEVGTDRRPFEDEWVWQRWSRSSLREVGRALEKKDMTRKRWKRRE
jgi:hypothetical protein